MVCKAEVQSGSEEHSVTTVVVLSFFSEARKLVGICNLERVFNTCPFEIDTLAVGTTIGGVEAVSGVEVTVHNSGVEVDVKSCIRSGRNRPRLCQSVFDAGVDGAVVTRLTVFFHHEVDDTGCSFGRVFRGRVGDEFYLFDALRRHLSKDICAVVRSQPGWFAVNPHFYIFGVAKGYVTFLVHVHGGDILQHVRYTCSCGSDIVADCEDFAVEFKSHRGALSHHFHFLKVLRIFLEVEFA